MHFLWAEISVAAERAWPAWHVKWIASREGDPAPRPAQCFLMERVRGSCAVRADIVDSGWKSVFVTLICAGNYCSGGILNSR